MKIKNALRIISVAITCITCISAYGQKKTAKQVTTVNVSIPDKPVAVDPMIYGQMLEDCNDRVIYGGIVNADGSYNRKVNELLKPLNMPVMRWPGGTYVMEYDWKKGVGPMKDRQTVQAEQWGQVETNLFGTDEFLQWCKDVGTEPYINVNMGVNPDHGGALGDALNWIEYVNGPATTILGKKRAKNGHEEPYNVKYWGIGNENYFFEKNYSDRLYRWSTVILSIYPDLKLLGVGHTCNWNDIVLRQNGKNISLLTLHFYMTAKIKNNMLIDEMYTTFSPVLAELNIRKNNELLDKYNASFGRTDNPVRFSIDEWNCRHSVFDGERFSFTRHDDRRLFDAATVAGMLNVFIRQSPYVGMANYIFPVNGHGLVRTAGQNDAFRTPPYYVFELYRKYMTGSRLETVIDGASVTLPVNKLAIEGDNNGDLLNGDIELTYVDAAAMQTDDETIHLALINRSPGESQKIKVNVPDGYVPVKMWRLESDNINNSNTADSRDVIIPQETELKGSVKTVTLVPCGFVLIRYRRK
jgi:alpha-N-arabinofuranosidase